MTTSISTSIYVKRNLAVIGTTIFCIAYAVLAHIVPPHYTWFEWHSNIMAVGVLLLSLIMVPFGLFILFAGMSPLSNAIAALLYYAFAGIITGIMLKSLWQKGWAARIALCIGFILNLGVGMFALAWGDVLVTENLSLSCKNFITPEQGLQIITFEQDRTLPGAHYFYLFSADGGNSWKQLFSEAHDEISEANCQTIQNLNNNFLWVWSSYHIRTSQDGGYTWKEWDWECCTFGAI